MKKSALKQYTSIFKTTTNKAKATAEKVAPGLLERGQIIPSMKGLANKAEGVVKEVGQAIGEKWAQMPSGIKKPVQSVINKIDKWKSKYILQGGKIANETAVNAANEAKNALMTKSGEMSYKNLRKLNQIWDEHFDISKGLDDLSGYKRKVERVGANALRSLIAKDSPDIAKLNKQFNFWTNVKNIASETAKNPPKTGGAKLAGTIAGAVAGHGVVGKVVEAATGNMIGKSVAKVIKSPFFKSVGAVYKNKIADYLMSGETKKLGGVIKKTSVIIKNLIDRE